MKTFVKRSPLTGMPMPIGWGNGYVIIPKGHPLHGKDYEDIDINVHGGLTFSESAETLLDEWDEISPEDREGWVVGFDTAHYGDDDTTWDYSAVVAETERLCDQIMNYKHK